MSVPLVVTPVVMPADLATARNGRLEPPILVDVRVPRWGTVQMHRHLARVWAAFSSACFDATGYELTVTSRADAYRNIYRQRSTFLDRYEQCSQAQYLWAAQFGRGKVWKKGVDGALDTTYWRKKQLPGGGWPATAAVPGTSNHGWGLALDLAVFISPTAPPAYLAASRAWPWVLANAARYGLSWEAQSETWHVRYYQGDNIPQAVIDFEWSNNPQPPGGPMSGEAKFVKIADSGVVVDTAVFIATGKTMVWVQSKAERQFHQFVGSASESETVPGEFHPWIFDRTQLRNFTLIGTPPVYGANAPPHTTIAADFQAQIT